MSTPVRFPVSRRIFLQGLASAPVLLGASKYGFAATTPIRYDIATPDGARMLEIYANAVRAMQGMGPDNPLSWSWQWYTHFVDGATNKAAELTRIFGDTTSPSRTLAEEVWNTCQSHSGQNASYFLPWHRFYVWTMERVVRQVSGHPEFTMPYWDYCSADPARRGVLPEQFRLPNDPVYDCLYRPNRTALANGGQPIQANQPGDAMAVDDIMAKTNYSTVGSVTGFCRAIDSGIHGRIHTLVGNGHGMGAVPYAGNDPLFCVHHCNIDRMWASWNRNGNKNPVDPVAYPWITTSFALADANGARISRQVKNLFSALQLGYDYDRFFPKPVVAPAPAPAPTTFAKSSAAPARIAASDAAADLGAGASKVRMLRIAGTRRTDVLGLDTDGLRSLLVLRKLHTWKQPEVLYHVYLTARATDRADDAHYVGAINFFDAQFHDHGGGSKLDEALGENFFSFDVTALLQKIARTSHGPATANELCVTFVPGGRPVAGANPMVASIELVRQ